jgi:7,8-dihydropterin-6-yl-methyl-4-(beta-D-ribofuranosyl)aminobenzene 5'-phosphate synthase
MYLTAHSCSHAGVINVVRDAVKQFERPIHMVIGGLHLGGPELHDRIAPTVDFMARRIRPSPTYVLPMHCSGFKVKSALEEEFGEGCVPAGVGMRYEVSGDKSMDERLSVSIV